MQISSGKIESAAKVVLYGPEGVGKSTFAAMTPGPVFVDVEGSTDDMDVLRLPKPESWTMLLETVRFVITNPTQVGTLVIDTADWAERLCVQHVCAAHHANSIEAVAGGYGKGYAILAEEYGNLLNLLSEVADRGVNVLLTAHANVRKFEQPDEMSAYDRWGLKLTNTKAGNGTASIVKEWAKTVLFMTYKTYAVKNETKTAKGQGGKHVIYTSHHPAYDAKNRIGLPDEIDIEGITEMPASLAVLFKTPAKASASAPSNEAPKDTHVAEPTAQEETDAAERHENRVHGGTDKTNAEIAVEPVHPPAVNRPKHLAALDQLMAKDDVTDEDVRKVVADKGYFPFATEVEKYPADFVEGVLVTAWPKVLEAINAAKQTSFDDVRSK